MDATELLQRYEIGERDFREQSFGKLDLSGATLKGADFKQASFTQVNLQGASLNNANFREAQFQGTSLKGANLENANLISTRMVRVEIGRASGRERV